MFQLLMIIFKKYKKHVPTIDDDMPKVKTHVPNIDDYIFQMYITLIPIIDPHKPKKQNTCSKY